MSTTESLLVIFGGGAFGWLFMFLLGCLPAGDLFDPDYGKTIGPRARSAVKGATIFAVFWMALAGLGWLGYDPNDTCEPRDVGAGRASYETC